MKNLNFVDPEVSNGVVSKQEILDDLKQSLQQSLFLENPPAFYNEWLEWLDSITNEVALTPDEAAVIYKLLGITDGFITEPENKLALLFSDRSSIPARFFRTDLWDNERIKSIPLLFEKYNGKEIFHPSVRKIIGEIKTHCANNKEFAQAYQIKLDEIRNNNGTLPERLALYADAYLKKDKEVIAYPPPPPPQKMTRILYY